MNVVFTPAAILEILNQIDELNDYDLSVSETLDNNIQIQVGSSIYMIDTDNIESVEVEEEVVDEVETINEEAYEDILSDENFENPQDTIESGLVKEALKSMLLGGALRLVKRLL